MSDIHRIVPINTDSISSSTPYVDISGNYYTNDNQRPQTEIDELDLSSTDDVPLAPTTEFGYYNLSAIDDTYVETEYETGAITSDEPESLWSSLTNWWDDVTDWWTDDRPLIEKIGQAVGATIVEVPISLLEGVALVGEWIFDFTTIFGAVITSVGAGIYDAYQAIHSLQTGEEWESLTIYTWEIVMAFVSESHVTNLFDSFYQDNPIGQWISENALFFNRSGKFTKIETSIRNIDDKDSVCDLLQHMEPAEVFEFLEHTDLSSYSYEQLLGIDDWCSWASSIYYGTQVDSIIRKVDRQIEEKNTQRTVDFNDWADTVMISNFRRLFPNYVTDEQLLALRGTYKILNPEDFAEVASSPRWMGFNNGTESVINLYYPDDIIRAVISHESLHQISSKPSYYDSSGCKIVKRGLKINIYDPNVGSWTSKYTGLNETVTEFLNELAMGEDYPTIEHSGYQPAVRRLKQILNMNIEGLDTEVIKKAYIDSDVSALASAIDEIAGPNFFEDRLVPAFDEAAIEGNLDELDKIIAELEILAS